MNLDHSELATPLILDTRDVSKTNFTAWKMAKISRVFTPEFYHVIAIQFSNYLIVSCLKLVPITTHFL